LTAVQVGNRFLVAFPATAVLQDAHDYLRFGDRRVDGCPR